MALDPNIALGVRPLEVPNQLAQYGQIQQLMAARDAQQFNALKMQEAQAAMEDRNALRRLDPTAADYESQLFKVNPQLGISFRKEQATTAAQKAAQQKSEFDLVAARRKFGDDLKRNLSANPSDENVVAWGQDAVLQGIYSQDQVASTVQQLLALPPQQRASILSQAGASPSELKPSTQTINRGGATEVIQVPAFGGAPTTLGSYAAVPLPADVQAQKAQIAQAAKPVQNVTMVAEKAEAGEFGKMLVNQFSDLSKAANLAVKTLPSIESNLSALNKGFDTGFGTETVAAGAKVLAALGVQNAEKFATNTQTFQSNAINAVLQKQLEQKGPQTESDARRIEQVGAELGKTKQANEFILSLAKEQLKRDIEQRNFYSKWKEKTDSFKGAEDAWFAGEGGKSLFDRPGLKKYAGAASAASQIPGQGPAAPAARTVVRTGTLNGRRVIQYSDGSTEYGN